jgi:hypothetical protein
MKFKFLSTKIASAAAILLFSLSISAIPITPTTGPTGNMQEIDGIYWAQPKLFINFTWNELNQVCPSGVCAGNFNNYDMTGWNWASTGDMNGMFNYLISEEIALGSQGINFSDNNNAEIKKLATDFGYTDRNSSYYGYSQLFVITSSLYELDNTQGTISRYLDDNQFGDSVYTGKAYAKDSRYYKFAAWFYYGDVSPSGIPHASPDANVDVPEPSTLAIFALGLISLAARRFKKKA